LRAIRAKRFWPDDLPFVFAPPKRNGLFLGRQFDAGYLSESNGSSRLSRKSFVDLSNCFSCSSKRKDARIACDSGIDRRARWRVVTDQQLRGFLVLSVMYSSIAAGARPYCSGLLAFSSTVRSELSDETVESMLETASGSARRGSDPAITHLESFALQPYDFAAALLDINILNLIFWQAQQLNVVVSTGVLSAVAVFLLDHQITALSTSKRKLAVRRPLDFIGYLRPTR